MKHPLLTEDQIRQFLFSPQASFQDICPDYPIAEVSHENGIRILASSLQREVFRAWHHYTENVEFDDEALLTATQWCRKIHNNRRRYYQACFDQNERTRNVRDAVYGHCYGLTSKLALLMNDFRHGASNNDILNEFQIQVLRYWLETNLMENIDAFGISREEAFTHFVKSQVIPPFFPMVDLVSAYSFRLLDVYKNRYGGDMCLSTYQGFADDLFHLTLLMAAKREAGCHLSSIAFLQGPEDLIVFKDNGASGLTFSFQSPPDDKAQDILKASSILESLKPAIAFNNDIHIGCPVSNAWVLDEQGNKRQFLDIHTRRVMTKFAEGFFGYMPKAELNYDQSVPSNLPSLNRG